ncbi:MAG: hypothetical protein ABS81_04365 [Pseudonocardia sp. SCN 72-86]|nr:MAG: hypothetical protein ABS81_04365 [Pseudonocardia sp. SCN 72-86]
MTIDAQTDTDVALAAGHGETSTGSPLLVRTTSVAEAEVRAARLLSPHRLRIGDGHLDARIHGTSLGSVALYHMNYGAAVTVSGPPLDGYLGLLLPLHGGIRVAHGPARFEISARRSAAVITTRAPMTLDWSPDLDLILLRVDSGPFEEFARDLTGRDDAGCCITPHLTDPRVLSGLLGSIRLIQLTAEQFPAGGGWPSAVAARVRDQVMLAMLLAQPTLREHLQQDSRPSVARRAVDEAVEVVRADPVRHLTTVSLAAGVGVSVRALQAGFREILDTTPHAYILDARLRRAREELQSARAGKGCSVAVVARRWGFVNLGRFASNYEQAYGEKPSDTLRRACAAGNH